MVRSAREPFLRLGDGLPDGMCVDAEDPHLWIAVWGLGQVRRYSPDGRPVDTLEGARTAHVECHVRRTIAGCTRHHDRAAEPDEEGRARWPDSGRLFTARPGAAANQPALWGGFTTHDR